MKSSYIIRVGILAGGAAVGLLAGRLIQSPNTQTAHASYEEYETLADLHQAATTVVRGVIADAGTAFLDYGSGSPSPDEGRAVPMRLFQIRVSLSDAPGGQFQVAVLDSDRLGQTGDAFLSEGDDVVLFLDAVDNSRFNVPGVTGDVFYVVVGGRQGVFRALSNGQWEQDADALLDPSEAGSQSNASRLVASLSELENATGR